MADYREAFVGIDAKLRNAIRLLRQAGREKFVSSARSSFGNQHGSHHSADRQPVRPRAFLLRGRPDRLRPLSSDPIAGP